MKRLINPSMILLELNEDGSFPVEENKVSFILMKILVLKQQSSMKIQLDSRKLLRTSPILISSLASDNLFHQCIEEKGSISKSELEKKFSLYYGEIDKFGTWSTEVAFEQTGSVFFQMLFTNLDENQINILDFGKPEWFNIEPKLTYKGSNISYQQITMQSLVSKCMGDSSRWKEILKAEADIGYNAFHFTPIQELGYSGSNYCIRDQLILNQKIFGDSNQYGKLKEIIDYARNDLNSLSFVDLVLNHTAADSKWLRDDSLAYYSGQNTPSLNSAILLDQAIQQFSKDIFESKSSYSKGKMISSIEDIEEIISILKTRYVEKLELPTYFLMNESKISASIRSEIKVKYPSLKIKENAPPDSEWMSNLFEKEKDEELIDLIYASITNLGASPHGVEFDHDSIVEFFKENKSKATFEHLTLAINSINKEWKAKAERFLSEAFSNLFNDIKYRKLECKNHLLVEDVNPITYPYFTKINEGVYAANNGWIFGGNALENFAISNEFHYFRRTIIVWGDLVKLRYGNGPEDCPKLWERMVSYTAKMAEVFQGFRIDNAHSTPIWVAEGLVKNARRINPNLHVFLELFTNSDTTDATFYKRIGANALVREFQRANDHTKIYESLQHYGRAKEFTVGSIRPLSIWNNQYVNVEGSQPLALLYDITHDNQHYSTVTSVKDELPRLAQLAFGNVFAGSTKGFDDLYSFNPSVVNEERQYSVQELASPTETQYEKTPCKVSIFLMNGGSVNTVTLYGNWDDWRTGIPLHQNKDFGDIFECEVSLDEGVYEYKFNVNGAWVTDPRKHVDSNTNHILKVTSNSTLTHENFRAVRKDTLAFQKLLGKDYPELYIEGKNYDTTTIMRQSEDKKSYYFLVSRNDIHGFNANVSVTIDLPGAIKNVHCIYHMENGVQALKSDKELVGGKGKIIQSTSLNCFADVYTQFGKLKDSLHFSNMPASFFCVLECEVQDWAKNGIEKIKNVVSEISNADVNKLFPDCSVDDMNYLLFSSAPEESEINGVSNYYLPEYGELVYAGFAGIYNIIYFCKKENLVHHSLYSNLRKGNWLLHFYLTRLKKRKSLSEFTKLFSKAVESLENIPRHDIPYYFTDFIWQTFEKIKEILKVKLWKFPKDLCQNDFTLNFLFATLQFLGSVPSGVFDNYKISFAAGLPHFSTGWSRSWGRDVFIAFKGGVLIPGYFQIGKEIIFSFAKCLRHGLIPNLLDGGRNPRYNCRDAAWWFIKGIKDYIDFSKDYSILDEKLELKYLSDDKDIHYELLNKGEKRIMTLAEIVLEIFQKHASGIEFIEWNAGIQIDHHMDSKGFKIQLKIDEETGFITGGNSHNCLTWMDKMGSSCKAGNKGKPATPRNGAPIELTALLKVCLDFVENLVSQGKISSKGVNIGKNLFTWKEWKTKIENNFEKCYYIPIEKDEYSNYNLDVEEIRKNGMYKDVYGAINTRDEYCLRPNACIAIAVAPELFKESHMQSYIKFAENLLLEPNSLGIKTLDEYSKDYSPFYDNSNDSNEERIAHGFSYHNGPEWVWVFHFFVKAYANAFPEASSQQILSFYSHHKRYMKNDRWLSLPELTNANGQFCQFSCPAQAWSIACGIETCHDILSGK